jgi:arylsulfatase
VTEAAPGGDGLRVLLVEVPSREAGLEALERLEAAVAEGHLQVEDAAVVHRDADGRIRVLQTHGPGTRKGVVRGGAIGFVVGLAVPAVLAATALGAAAGALVAKARDRGIDGDMLARLGGLIEGSEAAVVVLADEESAAALQARIDDLVHEGASVDREVLPQEAQELIRDAIAHGPGTG